MIIHSLCILQAGLEVVMKNEDARSSTARLKSFKGWNGNIRAQALAHAGFIYRNVRDQVQCVTCGLAIEELASYQEFFLLHKQCSPTCYYTQSNYKEPLLPQPPDSIKNISSTMNEETKLCKICYSNEMCIVFFPCFHVISCKACANRLKCCPLCCSNVVLKKKVFISF
jgi:hypothetical protein